MKKSVFPEKKINLALALMLLAASAGSGLAQTASPEAPPQTAPETEAEPDAQPPADAAPDDAAEGTAETQSPAAPSDDPGASSEPAREAAPGSAPSGDAAAPAETLAQPPALEAEKPAAAAAPPAPRSPVTLNVATWGGGYEQAQRNAIFAPFQKEGEDKINVVRHDGSLEALVNQMMRGGPGWDVADLSSRVAARGCDMGLLEPLDAAVIAGEPSGVDPAADFLPGAIKPCAIGSVAWSAVILYSKTAYAKRAPSALEHLFELKAFPGKRLLPRGPKYNLELALMADGVEPGNVYASLSTPEGQVRALNKLSQIKSAIVWWDNANDPALKLADGAAAMALAFNGRAFHAIVSGRQPLGLIWDGQIYDLDFWAIPKGSRNVEAAKEFIRYATAPERLAAQTRWLPYGPVRLSALSGVGKHAAIDIDMAPFIPTVTENFKRALAIDEAWWSANEAVIRTKFDAWLDGRSYEAPLTEPVAGDAAANAPKAQN